MKVALVSTYDELGGASRAALRLQRALGGLGVDAHLVVQEQSGSDGGVVAPAGLAGRALAKLRPLADQLPVWAHRHRDSSAFSAAWLPTDAARRVRALGPDVVHLHWVHAGFLPIEAVPSLATADQPLVWTLHDAWAFTGGCHVPLACTRYQQACGACPQLGSRREHDLSRLIWRRKQRAWRRAAPTVVTPSRWLAGCARQSGLLGGARIQVIPNPLDLEVYRPIDRCEARALLGLPRERKLVAFGAMHWERDRNKGAHLLREALARLVAGGGAAGVELVTFGGVAGARAQADPLPVHALGRLHDDVALALLYAAADVLVAPSLQENLPYAIMEALACGTPAVAFDTGGVGELIAHERNGYLARPFDAVDLAQGIRWILDDDARRAALGRAARQGCLERFAAAQVARQYQALYRESRQRG